MLYDHFKGENIKLRAAELFTYFSLTWISNTISLKKIYIFKIRISQIELYALL